MFSLARDYEQLNLMERVSALGALPVHKPKKFLQLLNDHIDLPTLIPRRFYDVYYGSETNKRGYRLESMLCILLLMHFFKFANVAHMRLTLDFSPQLREFCQLPEDDCPGDSVLSKFKITFVDELRLFFEALSLRVMDIFDEYDQTLPDTSPLKGMNQTLVYDSTGLKPKVKENNPKSLAAELKRQESYRKVLVKQGKGDNFNVYHAAFARMPKYASANAAIRLGYANGHFGYFYKMGIACNGFGIPLHIHFLDDDFYANLPIEFATPDDQKYAFDNASLHPVLSSFYSRIGHRRFHTFMGDSEFDSYDNYGFLGSLGFEKMLIPINARNAPLSNDPIPRDAENIPCCPRDTSLQFIPNGSCKGKNRSLRFKYICPKSRFKNGKFTSDCRNMCRDTNSVITTYTYPSDDLRTFPGILRGSKQWKTLYKRRTIIEREISSMKSHPALERPNTYNTASIRADVFLNASVKLITVMLAFALDKPFYMRNIKNLLLAA